MKPIGVHFNKEEAAFERFAWWPVCSTFSNKRIWLKKYIELHIYYDQMGRPPLKGASWNLIYTEKEYMIYLLKKGKHATD